jgi:hypothetical protein
MWLENCKTWLKRGSNVAQIIAKQKRAWIIPALFCYAFISAFVGIILSNIVAAAPF